jgi:transcriptional regulator with XRE-family HTH domain
MNVAEGLGANLGRARRAAGISQENLSLLAGMHRTAISQIESGKRVPRADTLLRFCSSMEIEPNALYAGLRFDPFRVYGGEMIIEVVPRAGGRREPADAA